MKTFLILFSFIFQITFYGQKNVIKFNLLGPPLKLFPIQFEHVLSNNNSIIFETIYIYRNTASNKSQVKAKGLGIEAGYKINIGKKISPQGMYFTPNIGVGYLTDNILEKENSEIYFFNFGYIIGHQIFLSKNNFGFLLNTSFGFNYYILSSKNIYPKSIIDLELSGYIPRICLGLGYAF